MGQRLVIFVSTVILLITGVLLGYVLSQLIQGVLELNLVTFLGTFSLIVIFGTLYYVLFWEFRRSPTQTLPSRRSATIYASDDAFDYELAPNQIYLKDRLIRLLDGDQERAERLVQNIRDKKPGMAEPWYWEKAIAELERDRR